MPEVPSTGWAPQMRSVCRWFPSSGYGVPRFPFSGPREEGLGARAPPFWSAGRKDLGGSGLLGASGAAYSGDRRNGLVAGDELIEFFAWGAVAEAFSGAVVEFVFDGLELGGGVLAEVGA